MLIVALFSPLARAEDPKEIVFIFQKQKDPTKIKSDADKLAGRLSTEVGIPVKAIVPSDYSASVEALVSKKADFAYVSSLPFLLARRDGKATLLVAEVRNDAAGKARTDYDSIFVVQADSDLKTVEDLFKKTKDLRMAFTSPTSTSGYIMPYYRFVKEGLLQKRQDPKTIFQSVAFGGGYTQALEQVLAGRADVAAVSDYVMEGPKTDTYLKPEQRQKLRVLGRTSGVPTHLVAARDGLSAELKSKMKDALLKIATDEPELLADVYGASAFKEVDEKEHVQQAIDAIDFIGLPIEGLAK
jgi:phosphonate transport system substrate-binding protein